MTVAAYRKLIAAVIGLGIMLVYKRWGVDLIGIEPMLVDVIVSGLTAFGVWAAPNDPLPEQPEDDFA